MVFWPKHLRLKNLLQRNPDLQFAGPVSTIEELSALHRQVFVDQPSFDQRNLATTSYETFTWPAGQVEFAIPRDVDLVIAIEVMVADRPGCRWGTTSDSNHPIPIEGSRYLLEGVFDHRVASYTPLFLRVQHPPTTDTEVRIYGIMFRYSQVLFRFDKFEDRNRSADDRRAVCWLGKTGRSPTSRDVKR